MPGNLEQNGWREQSQCLKLHTADAFAGWHVSPPRIERVDEARPRGLGGQAEPFDSSLGRKWVESFPVLLRRPTHWNHLHQLSAGYERSRMRVPTGSAPTITTNLDRQVIFLAPSGYH